MKNARRLLRKLDYLPRWAWYMLSLFIGGPIGPFVVYLVFHVLTKAADDEETEQDSDDWGASYDRSGRTYADADCTVTDDAEIEDAWQKTESSASRARREAQPAENTQTDSADDEVSEVIREGRAAMRRIRHANDLIPDPELSAQIDSIENSCGQILSILEQRPQLLSQLRTFLRYYLPTTLRLLEARAKLEKSANTPKAREVRARISQAVGEIDTAFRKQVEALDEYRFIDLESEMDVMRDMLKSDGLIDVLKKSFWLLLTLVLLCAAAPAQADKSPLVQALGSEQAARHLATHIYARKDHWDGTLPFFCPDETCKDYGHVRLTGRRVTLWDSPGKGDSRVAYYPNGTTNKVGPDTEFELTNVVAYKGRYYANIRITDDHGAVVNSGFVNADYIACDCKSYTVFEDVDEYVYRFGPFSLK